MQAKVLTVNAVLLLHAPDQHCFIVATGTVSTSGWSNGELQPRIYIHPPEDGVWDWDFVATPPDGIAADVISPVTAQSVVFTPPEWMLGVRVHASTNTLVASVAAVDVQIRRAPPTIQGGVDTWPWLVVAHRSDGADVNAMSSEQHRNFSMDDLIGKTLRTYETGDPLTKDYRVDRFNCELKPGTHSIVNVWVG